MKKTIAENMYDIMIEQEFEIVWYGNLDIIEECARRSNIISKHPKLTIVRVLNGLEKSDLFIKGYIKADFDGRNRRYRSFKLKTPFTEV